MGKKLPTTPRSRVRAALRGQVWLRSRERAAALKRSEYCCERCGKKQSKAKDRCLETTVPGLEVHHLDGVDWEELIDLVFDRLLHNPARLKVLCKECHTAEHAEDEDG